MDIDQHLGLLRAIQARVPDQASVLAIYTEMNKDRRMAEINNNKVATAMKAAPSAIEPPTPKQIELLTKNKQAVPATKDEATKAIADMIAGWSKD